MQLTSMAVADRLHGQSRFLLRADEVGKSGRLLDLLQADIAFRRRLPRTAVAQFARELSVMLAGRPRYRPRAALSRRDEREQPRATDFSGACAIRCGQANRLAAGLAEHPAGLFPPLRQSGARRRGRRQARRTRWRILPICSNASSRLAATIQSALTYPILLAIASIGTIVLLLTYVLPQFTPIFAQAGAQLPTATRILIGIGDIVRADGGSDPGRVAVLRPRGLSGVASARHAPCSGRGLASPAVRGPADPKSSGRAS